MRSYPRWTRNGEAVMGDGRKEAIRAAPANKLGDQEREQLLEVANRFEFAGLPRSQTGPTHADEVSIWHRSLLG